MSERSRIRYAIIGRRLPGLMFNRVGVMIFKTEAAVRQIRVGCCDTCTDYNKVLGTLKAWLDYCKQRILRVDGAGKLGVPRLLRDGFSGTIITTYYGFLGVRILRRICVVCCGVLCSPTMYFLFRLSR